MARKPRDQDQAASAEGESVYTSPVGAFAVDDVDDSAPLINQSPVGSNAAQRDGVAIADAPKAASYVVMREQWIMARGGRTILRQGKVIDSLNYDITSLLSQGVALQECG